MLLTHGHVRRMYMFLHFKFVLCSLKIDFGMFVGWSAIPASSSLRAGLVMMAIPASLLLYFVRLELIFRRC